MSGRRARGEGTVYYDESRNRWIGAVTIGGRRRKVIGKDKTEARARLQELLAAKSTGALVTDGSLTVGAVLDAFMERSVPAIVNSPSSKAMSASAASKISAAILVPFSIILSAAKVIAVPPIMAEREPKVPRPCTTLSVSPSTRRTGR